MATNVDAILKNFDRVVDVLNSGKMVTISALSRILKINPVKIHKILAFLVAYDVVEVVLFGRSMILRLKENWKESYEKFKKDFVEKNKYTIFYEKN